MKIINFMIKNQYNLEIIILVVKFKKDFILTFEIVLL
jgi:hypothetical protein